MQADCCKQDAWGKGKQCSMNCTCALTHVCCLRSIARVKIKAKAVDHGHEARKHGREARKHNNAVMDCMPAISC